jgi:hypothetical protein
MTAAIPATDALMLALAVEPGTVAELAQRAGLGHSTTGKALVILERDGRVRRHPGGRDRGRRLPDRWALADSLETPPVAEPRQVGPKDSTRLGRGALRAMVLDYVRSQPGEASPSTIASVLQHSSGAVGNSLAKLADADEIRLTSVSPRRYARAD